MLTLYQFERTWGIPNLSPFCCKIETYLRMANIDYTIKPSLPLGAPKGKLPYIEDSGQALADSRFIITHLKSSHKNLDSELNDAELATSLARPLHNRKNFAVVTEKIFQVTLVARHFNRK